MGSYDGGSCPWPAGDHRAPWLDKDKGEATGEV